MAWTPNREKGGWWTHVEKMLYDNAQLARVSLNAYQITGNEFYKQVTTEILDYVVREMTSPKGGFIRRRTRIPKGTKASFLCGRRRRFGARWVGARRGC